MCLGIPPLMIQLGKEVMNNSKYESENKTIRISNDTTTIELSVVSPRLILVRGVDRKGRKVERHLKITDKSKLLLV